MSEKICQHEKRRPAQYKEKGRKGKYIKIRNVDYCPDCKAILQIITTAYSSAYTQKLLKPVMIGYKTTET